MPAFASWTPAIASSTGLISSLALSGSPLTVNWTSTEWPSREIWPPPPIRTSGFWMFVTFFWPSSVCTTPAIAEMKSGSLAVCCRLWTRTLSVAGCLKPACSSRPIAVAVSPAAAFESGICTWPTTLPSAIASAASTSQP